MWLDALPSLQTLAIALPAVTVAYVIFGIAGFGTELIAAPGRHDRSPARAARLRRSDDQRRAPLAGVYADWRMLTLALLLAPGMLLGTRAGHHLTLRLSREQFMRVLYVVLIGSGLTLLIRAWTAA